jgi:hypothetical protein
MRVLAIRTPDGHYLEFTTIRANLEDGSEIAVELSRAVFAQVITVPEPPKPEPPPEPERNGRRTIVIDGAGGIESQEVVKG